MITIRIIVHGKFGKIAELFKERDSRINAVKVIVMSNQEKIKQVLYYRATWHTCQPKLEKIKKIHPKMNSLYLKKWNFLTLTLRNFLYFLKRKHLSYYGKWNPALFKPELEKILKNPPRESFLYFKKRKPRKNFLHFLKRKLSFMFQ